MGRRESAGFKPQLCAGMVGRGTDRAWAGPKVDPDRSFVQCAWRGNDTLKAVCGELVYPERQGTF